LNRIIKTHTERRLERGEAQLMNDELTLLAIADNEDETKGDDQLEEETNIQTARMLLTVYGLWSNMKYSFIFRIRKSCTTYNVHWRV
jgi:hypothetical protein